MATHSSVLAWRIPGTGEPGGLPSMGSHRVRHDWSDLAVVVADWSRKWQPTPVILPGKFHGRRSLIGYSPWGCKESDRTERLYFHFHSAYTLNKQGDNIQLWHTLFPIWNQPIVPCPVLKCCLLTCIQISQEAAQVVWYSHLFYNYPQFVVIHAVKGFGIVIKMK